MGRLDIGVGAEFPVDEPEPDQSGQTRSETPDSADDWRRQKEEWRRRKHEWKAQYRAHKTDWRAARDAFRSDLKQSLARNFRDFHSDAPFLTRVLIVLGSIALVIALLPVFVLFGFVAIAIALFFAAWRTSHRRDFQGKPHA
jgi:type III secretory pathway component EscV